MSTMATIPQIHELVEASRASITRWLHRMPSLLLALTIGLLNPTLCVLQCYLGHGSHLIAERAAAHGQHDSHKHLADAGGKAHQHAGCSTSDLGQSIQLTPRAAYESVASALGLGLVALIFVARALQSFLRPRLAPLLSPPTPPPQPLAFV